MSALVPEKNSAGQQVRMEYKARRQGLVSENNPSLLSPAWAARTEFLHALAGLLLVVVPAGALLLQEELEHVAEFVLELRRVEQQLHQRSLVVAREDELAQLLVARVGV